MKRIQTVLATILLLPLCSHAANLELAAIFDDHMVLQRDMKVPVWGWAQANAVVTVEFGGQVKSTHADAAGKWIVELDPLKTIADPQDLTVTAGGSTLKRSDILVGEVWLCSGQSNMEWAIARSDGGVEALKTSANPLFRICTISHNSQLEPAEKVAAKWVISGDKSAEYFSAIGWWMGSKLQKQLGVPVAIINDSFGGTTIQAWMPLETLRRMPLPKDKNNDRDFAKAEYDGRMAAARPVMNKYLIDKAAAIQAKKTPPPFPTNWPGDFRGPAVLWNGMINPILKFPIRGVAWYQGESNAYPTAADTYKDLLPALIRDWRSAFGQPELPFVIFQIARNRKPQTDANENSGIAVIQEAQQKTVLATRHTLLVVTEDLGEQDVHYKRKEPAADRGVSAMMFLAYGSTTDPTGPTFDRLEIKGDQAVVHFTHTAGGLMADGAVKGFVIAGEDHKFVFAEARIDGDSVIIASETISKPVAVRYGWADMPEVNVFNKAGIPASPFRTDAH